MVFCCSCFWAFKTILEVPFSDSNELFYFGICLTDEIKFGLRILAGSSWATIWTTGSCMPLTESFYSGRSLPKFRLILIGPSFYSYGVRGSSCSCSLLSSIKLLSSLSFYGDGSWLRSIAIFCYLLVLSISFNRIFVSSKARFFKRVDEVLLLFSAAESLLSLLSGI